MTQVMEDIKGYIMHTQRVPGLRISVYIKDDRM